MCRRGGASTVQRPAEDAPVRGEALGAVPGHEETLPRNPAGREGGQAVHIGHVEGDLPAEDLQHLGDVPEVHERHAEDQS